MRSHRRPLPRLPRREPNVVSELRECDISRVIRQVRPQRVVIQSPERNWNRIYLSHPDHLAAGGEAIRRLTRTPRNPVCTPGCCCRMRDSRTGLFLRCGVMAAEGPGINFVDVTDSSIANWLRCALTNRRPPTATILRT